MKLPYTSNTAKLTFTSDEELVMLRNLLSTLLMHCEGEFASTTDELEVTPSDAGILKRREFWDIARTEYSAELACLDEKLATE